MARPKLTEESFLSHLFKPSKNPLPSGIRKSTLKGLKSHKKTRVNSWNKMPAKNQEILRRAGMKDSFLKGESTLVEARRRLRITAVEKGIAKPVRLRRPSKSTADDVYDTYRHLDQLIQTERKDQDHLRVNAMVMSPDQRTEVRKLKTFNDYRTEAYSDSAKWKATYEDGETRSVLWYH